MVCEIYDQVIQPDLGISFFGGNHYQFVQTNLLRFVSHHLLNA